MQSSGWERSDRVREQKQLGRLACRAALFKVLTNLRWIHTLQRFGAQRQSRKRKQLGRLACRAAMFRELTNLSWTHALQRFGAKRQKLKWRFDQLHLSVFFPMQHLHPALVIAKDKYLTVTELGFFDRLF